MSAPPNANKIEQNLGYKLEIEVISDKNNTYKVELVAETYSYLEIKAIQKSSILNKSFSNKFTVEKIKENKYFTLFEDLKEICNELSLQINNKVSLKENNNLLNKKKIKWIN